MSDARSIKAEARQLVEGLPEGATWDDLAYEVYVRASIEAGLADANAGRTVSTDDALARVRARTRRLQRGGQGRSALVRYSRSDHSV
jgi:predicted transcriptional regulator